MQGMVNIKSNINIKEIVSSYVNPYQWRDFDIRSICKFATRAVSIRVVGKMATNVSVAINFVTAKKKNVASITFISRVSQKRVIRIHYTNILKRLFSHSKLY